MRHSFREMMKREGGLRLVATCFLVVIVCLIRTNSQTKILFDVLEKKATYRDIHIFEIQLYVICAAGGYSFLQLIRCCLLDSQHPQSADLTLSNHVPLLAVTFFLDQVAVYAVFATNCAAAMASYFAVAGNDPLQWGKVCNVYTRFCHQVASYLLLVFATSLLMAYISMLSAFFLFRFYSPNRILCLKNQPLSTAT